MASTTPPALPLVPPPQQPLQPAHGVAEEVEGPAPPPAPDAFLQTEIEEARLLVRWTPFMCSA